VLSGTLGVSRSGAVKVGLSCTGPDVCAGTAWLSIAVAVSTTARRASRRVIVGTTRFRLPAGRHGSVRVRLNATGRSFLRRHAGRATATLTVASASGTRSTTARLRSLK
jgi:hypothetical protein